MGSWRTSRTQVNWQTFSRDAQRQAYLRQQLLAIKKELGEDDEESGEEQIAQLRVRLEQAQLPVEVMAQAERELKRLRFIPDASPEHAVIVSYLETLADLPWQKASEDHLDLDEAQRILDRYHFDLQKVKRRLIEYLAVRKLNPNGRGPIVSLARPESERPALGSQSPMRWDGNSLRAQLTSKCMCKLRTSRLPAGPNVRQPHRQSDTALEEWGKRREEADRAHGGVVNATVGAFRPSKSAERSGADKGGASSDGTRCDSAL